MLIYRYMSSHAHEVPNLQTLAAPFEVAGSLPNGIPVSIGLIANTPRDVLRQAINDPLFDYAVTEHATRLEPTQSIQDIYDDGVNYFNGTRQQMLDENTAELTELQDRMGMEMSVGFDPESSDLSRQFQLFERLDEVAAMDTDKLPSIENIRETLIERMVERANAELDLPGIQPTKELAEQVEKDIWRLGRRGRLGITAAATLFTTSVIFGIYGAHVHEANKTIDKTQPSAEDSGNGAVGAFGIIALGGVVLSTGLAYPIGTQMTPRFAQGRARKMIRKAGKAAK